MRLLALVAAVAAAAATAVPAPDMSWEKSYAHWRNRAPVPLSRWWASMKTPPPTSPPAQEFAALSPSDRQTAFYSCLDDQTAEFSSRVARYQPPNLAEVGAAARSALRDHNKTVTLTIFWGRERYVSILWKFLERNLVPNGGIVDKLLLVTKYRNQDEEGKAGAQRIVNNGLAKYPKHVVQVPMCKDAYGCAFDQWMTDDYTVYVKVDDDIIFIKDGSIEHLVLQVLKNPDYSFYSGSVVNNPHSFAVHRFVGAYPPVTYHWRDLAPAEPPFIGPQAAGKFYYGKNMYDSAGSQAHEAFIYNAAHGRLDVYGYDVWNQNQCRCGQPQAGLDMCSSDGFYRWNVNVFAYLREGTLLMKRKMPGFDEPAIGMLWPKVMAPHRVGMVGEALFVHYEFTVQRQSRPDFGLREQILLPWYHEFSNQYTAQPWGKWAGNATLLGLYETMAWQAGENRFSANPTGERGGHPPPLV